MISANQQTSRNKVVIISKIRETIYKYENQSVLVIDLMKLLQRGKIKY